MLIYHTEHTLAYVGFIYAIRMIKMAKNKNCWLTSQANRRSSGWSVNFAINGPNFVPLLIFAFENTAPLRMSKFFVWSCKNLDISSIKYSLVS